MLLTITTENGQSADVDVNLESIDLDTRKGQAELAQAVKTALQQIEEEMEDEEDAND